MSMELAALAMARVSERVMSPRQSSTRGAAERVAMHARVLRRNSPDVKRDKAPTGTSSHFAL